ncbi:50S ribosomal protein L35 [Patescibacteria group bacterium]|nr:50S ribosomal protein L35 [Patescibacteria group bacterium]
MGKTNKSFQKRLRVTKNGKVLARKPGQNHFLAKQTRESQLNKKGLKPFLMNKKTLGKYLPGK